MMESLMRKQTTQMEKLSQTKKKRRTRADQPKERLGRQNAIFATNLF
jgi:hypothetical protein